MSDWKLNTPPSDGQPITQDDKGKLNVPDNPIIPFIEGDGIGPDIWAAAKIVFDAAVEKAFGGKRKISWFEIYAGEKAKNKCDEWLPEETLKAITEFKVAIKGPLTTPIGEGIRSLNVSLRQQLTLYACVRPVRWFEGVGSPVKRPADLDVVIFRENVEDVYAGIEFEADSKEANELIDYVGNLGKKIIPGSGIGIKPMSSLGTKRLMRKAIQYAINNNRTSVTITHKGNIMKFTEGAFRNWSYEVAKDEFRDQIITEEELWDKFDGKMPEGKILIKDRIADAMFQQILLRPTEYDVIATPNLNGDYMSDSCAAIVGGLGLAPGANIGDEAALFEATHGTAPKYTGQDKVNPGSVILSGAMMFEYLGWKECSDLIKEGISKAVAKKQVTYDLARTMEGATTIKCSAFGQAVADEIAQLAPASV